MTGYPATTGSPLGTRAETEKPGKRDCSMRRSSRSRGRKLLLKEYASAPVQKEKKLCGYTIKQDFERALPKVVVDKTWKHHFCMLCSALHSIDLVSTEIIVANRKEMKSTAAQKHALDFFREAIMRE
jgi:hypothetical protein